MNKKRFLIFNIIFIFFALLFLTDISYAATTLDEIEDYTVTVDPRMNDGTLDITYEIVWKVLDSTTEGPLEWVQIGTPNSNFDTATAITSNIKSISKYNSSYVKITFDRSYYAGEEITFKYSIHQSYMYELEDDTEVLYEFTPAWFTDAEVKKLTIRWNSDKVIESDKTSEDGGYLVWTKVNMSKGEKLTATIKYEQSSFTALDANKQKSNSSSNTWSTLSYVIAYFLKKFLYVIFIIFFIYILIRPSGYYGHRGFYGGGYYGGFYGGRRPPRSGGGGRRMCSQ